MKQIVLFWVIAVLCFFFTLYSHAEVNVHGQSLTAHLKEASLAIVLTEISQQSRIDIAVLNTSDYHKAVVSDVLEDVPLEQGLERLLNGWNYGFTKDPITGAVQKLMIISRRTEILETHSAKPDFQIYSNRLEEKDPDTRAEELNIPDIGEEKPYMTDEDLLENALPEVQELIAKMQAEVDE